MLDLSYSRIKTFQTCQRKYYWEYVAKIESTGRQVPLEFGSAWHLAMDAWHRSRDEAQAWAAFEGAFTDSPEDRKRTRDTAKRMLHLYTERYATEPFSIVKTEQWLTIAVRDFRYRMRIDKVVNEAGELAVLDHKTTGSLGFHYIKGFKPNLQLAGYVKGVQEQVDPRVSRVLVDVALTTKLEPRSGDRFLRYPDTVEAWELREFDKIVEQIGWAVLQRGEDFAAYTPNWNACTQYGECPYRRLCMAPPETREAIQRIEYQEKEGASHDAE